MSLDADIEQLKATMASNNPFHSDAKRSSANTGAVTSRRPLSVGSSPLANGSAPRAQRTDPESKAPDAPSEVEIAHQKEENRRKQALLKQSLDAQRKKLLKEQSRIAYVQTELQSMESELARDVEKLREMIDTVSYDIAYYERDYEQKRKAYLESKKLVTGLKERRDNLTKHLHTIIATNEERKAQKLEELISRLDPSQTQSQGTVASGDRKESHTRQRHPPQRTISDQESQTQAQVESQSAPTQSQKGLPSKPHPQAQPVKAEIPQVHRAQPMALGSQPKYRFSGFPDAALDEN